LAARRWTTLATSSPVLARPTEMWLVKFVMTFSGMSAVISVLIRSASLPLACWSAQNIGSDWSYMSGGTVPDQIAGPSPDHPKCAARVKFWVHGMPPAGKIAAKAADSSEALCGGSLVARGIALVESDGGEVVLASVSRGLRALPLPAMPMLVVPPATNCTESTRRSEMGTRSDARRSN
jgi:hypothetical protein